MARGLNRGRFAQEPGSRRAAFVTVVGVVVLLHLIVTHEVAAELADFNAANAMPARIQVAYVRTLEPEAPKVAAPLPAAKVAAAPARPRAVSPSKDGNDVPVFLFFLIASRKMRHCHQIWKPQWLSGSCCRMAAATSWGVSRSKKLRNPGSAASSSDSST